MKLCNSKPLLKLILFLMVQTLFSQGPNIKIYKCLYYRDNHISWKIMVIIFNNLY